MIIITKTVSYANCSQLQWIELNVVKDFSERPAAKTCSQDAYACAEILANQMRCALKQQVGTV